MSGEISVCLNCGSAIGTYRFEARDAVQYPTMYMTTPTTENYPAEMSTVMR